MSVDVKVQGEGTTDSPQDPLKNVKAEFDRKFGNIETQLKSSNEALMKQIQQLTGILKPSTPQEAKGKKPVSVFDDEEGYRAETIAEVEARIERKLQSERAMQAKQAQTIQTLVRDFPELADSNHPLTLKAVEIYNAMPEDERNHPLAYKTAAKEAALELDIKPKAKRETKDESYSFGAGKGSEGKTYKKDDKLDQGVIDFAHMMGLDVEDPKIVEKLTKRQKSMKSIGKGVFTFDRVK